MIFTYVEIDFLKSLMPYIKFKILQFSDHVVLVHMVKMAGL